MSAFWASKVADSHAPQKVALLEIRKYVERKWEEALAVAEDFKAKGRPDCGARCWLAAEALDELVGDIDRRTGQAEPPAQNVLVATARTRNNPYEH